MKYFITTSIPYVNAEPHIGHALEFIQSDVLARAARARGDVVIFSTGTDEHGSKIAAKAAEAGQKPKAFTDKYSQDFIDLLKLLNISNDRFVRTTDPDHEKRAQKIWTDLTKFIYKGSYEGWYCVGCETFVSESTAKANKGICPIHKKPYEKLKEDNYFFKLSHFEPQIREAIETDSFIIVPEFRRNEILQVLRDGLEDISISRPTEKLAWGISVPSDSSQVMYVWFEALLNYITVLGYRDKDDFKNFWPASVQVIGKDILRFHAAIWPGILLGLGLELPKKLFVHGFITVEGEKMSKSLGNVIKPKQIVKEFGVDGCRYYFLRHISAYEDGDFSWTRLQAAYNAELANELGNSVQRTAAMIEQYQKGIIGTIPGFEHDSQAYFEALDNFRFDKALEEVWEQIRGLNQYIDEQKPWEVHKTGDKDHLREILAYQVSCLLEVADLLLPFLPDTAAKIAKIFASGVVNLPAGSLFPRKDEALDLG